MNIRSFRPLDHTLTGRSTDGARARYRHGGALGRDLDALHDLHRPRAPKRAHVHVVPLLSRNELKVHLGEYGAYDLVIAL